MRQNFRQCSSVHVIYFLLDLVLLFDSLEKSPALISISTADHFDLPAINEVVVVLEAKGLDKVLLGRFEPLHFRFENRDKLGRLVNCFHVFETSSERGKKAISCK
jgi:hypothetical protein